ncbi:MAG TPA: outer membrane beta-barrel protein [Puia sp.]
MPVPELISTFPIQGGRRVLLFLLIVFSAVCGYSQKTDTTHKKFDSLAPVIVRPKALPPRMKGDTLEYNTDGIRLKPNAAVEELLARLPGLQVDASGNITLNGEKIQKLLVDGEDLFSADPTIVTKNFNADMIARVQVLDRKSDQAAFTGIDDGNRTKTLNLVLKESSKKGYFGKLEAGGDTQGTYNANGLLGSFKGREQFTALGLASNTGALGFNGNTGDPQARLNVLSFTGDALGGSAGTGIPRVAATALHYANSWDGKEDHVMGNYQYGHLYTQPFTTSRTVQTLPDSIYTQDLQNNSLNSQDQHLFYGVYDFVPDSLSALKLSVNGLTQRGRNQFSSIGSSAFNDTLVNSSLRMIHSVVKNQNAGGSLFWRSRVHKKPGRSFSFIAGLNRLDNETTGYLYAKNRFYGAGGVWLSADTIDQRKQIGSKGYTLNGGVNYTEPLWKNTVLGLGYGLSRNDNESLQYTWNRGDGKYQDFIDSLSTHFQGVTVTQNALINLQEKSARFTYTLGGSVIWYNYRQKDLLSDSTLRYSYVNFAPLAVVNYTIDPFTSWHFTYSANTQQPSITQLQPVKNNNDPLHLVLGNPDLHPSLTQNFGLWFRRLKPFVLNLGLNFGVTGNSISTKTYTDSLGRQISQAVNVGGAQNAGLNFMINNKLEPWGIDAGFHINASYGRSVNYVGVDLSRNDNYIAGGGFSLAKYVPDKYSIQLNTNFSYFYNRSSVNVTAPTHYWTQSHYGLFSFFPFRGFEINTTVNYTWQQQTGNFGNSTSVLLWNGFVSQNFLNNQLTIRASINNLLDRNAGISRSNLGNTNSETTTNIMGRYWMLSGIWHFTHRRREK